jgi:prepilin-type N-terminal cleavage/methylation domain-containing protein
MQSRGYKKHHTNQGIFSSCKNKNNSYIFRINIYFFIYREMKFFMKKTKKAFTLVEMLIVIVIIGILAAALIPRLSSARGRANDTARKADLQQVASALVAYQIDHGTFPTATPAAPSLSVISTDLVSA